MATIGCSFNTSGFLVAGVPWRLSMKGGDLVRRRRKPLDLSWVGLVTKVDNEGHVWILWADDGTVDDCSSGLMEVISES